MSIEPPRQPVASEPPGSRPPSEQTAAFAQRVAAALRVTGRGLLVPVLAVFSALVIGAVVIVLSDLTFLQRLGADPGAAIRDAIGSVGNAYGALFGGAVGDPAAYAQAFQSGDPAAMITAFTPLSETLLSATPLIFTGLAVALGFQCGLFNIGAEGQLFVGAAAGTFVGFAITGLPWFIHLPLTIGAGFLGGALWGFIPGFLKARTGAHEVIVTIMLNYIAYRLVDFILKLPGYQREGRSDPISKVTEASAWYPPLVEGLRANWGFALGLVAAMALSWLLFRSTKGFELRAVGLNAFAARYAGMSIASATILAMMLSGGLAGLAGTSVVLGVTKSLTSGISPGFGFDGIAIALIAGSRPRGVVLASLLFGALRAGSTPMQSTTGIPIDLVVIIQALVIMFVAAPALVRGIYRIRVPETTGTETFSKGWGS
ncbi:MAG TPA: ABC transporter permease [Candidatus Eisenbacteria bacterium]|nr:ABC transporter permease [Candidatus Eisenbacteria bacterium]